MDYIHRKVLRILRDDLVKDLKVSYLFPKLGIKILNPTDEGEITAESTREKEVMKLLDILPNRGPDAFHEFVAVLKTDYEWLPWKLMEEELKLSKETLANVRSSSANLRERISKVEGQLEERPNKETAGIELNETQAIKKMKEGFETKIRELMEELATQEKELQMIRGRRISGDIENYPDMVNNRSGELKPTREALANVRSSSANLRERISKMEGQLEERPNKETAGIELNEIQVIKKMIGELEKKITTQEKEQQMARGRRNPDMMNNQSGDALEDSECTKCKENVERYSKLAAKKDKMEGRLKKKITDLQTDNRLIKSEKTKLEGKISKLEKLKKTSMEQMEQLENELQQKKEGAKTMAKKLEVSNDEHKKLEEKASELQQSLTCSKKITSQLQKKISSLKAPCGRVFGFREELDRNGVIYALTSNRLNCAGASATPLCITAFRSSDNNGDAKDLLGIHKRGTMSSTKDEKESWWCVDLGKEHLLLLTHYTLRHGRDNGESLIRHWRLEGSLDRQTWKTLKNHDEDRRLTGIHPFCTGTWSIDGEISAMRYFRIRQTGKNSSGRYGLYLSGLELYGVLFS